MPALTDYDIDTLSAEFAAAGMLRRHAAKLLTRFYRDHGSLDTTGLCLGKATEQYVAERIPLRQSTILIRTPSADGTVKLLIGYDRGGAAEAVLMPGFDRSKAAGCISSQIGCAMGCDFCASTKGGLERNLSAGEIVEQFLHLRAQAAAIGRRLATLVFMGMGEPMHNLDSVIAAIRRIAAERMGHLGGRQITVSTVGIVPGIQRLAEAQLNVQLALSLHAPDDATRARLVPSNRRYGVGEIIAAARDFHERTGRVVNIEYCLLGGVNDSDEQAVMLADLLAGFRAHVNLIPYNPIGAGLSGIVYLRPPRARVVRFLQILQERAVVAHLRVTRGDDVSAACGQLRAAALPISNAE